jgi:hypothetical protein
VLAVLLALLLLLLLKKKKKKSTNPPAPEDNVVLDSDDPFPPMEEDPDTKTRGDYVSEYGLSDYGQLNARGDLEDAPAAPQPDDAEDEVEYAAEYGLSEQGATRDDLRDDLPIGRPEAGGIEGSWLE